jgi:starch synthase (maltosyl-transferring)
MIGRIVIEDIRPQVDGGLYPSRAVAGETVPVEATIFRDGHNEVVAAAVRLKGPGDRGRASSSPWPRSTTASTSGGARSP